MTGKTVLACVALLSVIAAGCTPTVSKFDASSAALSETREQVEVTVEPLLDSVTRRRTFGSELTSVNIVPVYVRIVNRHPERSVILTEESIGLDGQTVPGRIHSGRSGTGEFLLMWGGLLPAAIGHQLIKEAAATRHNLILNELRSGTVDPSETHEGFLYLNGRRVAPTVELTIRLINPGQSLDNSPDNSLRFLFPVSTERD